MRVAPSEIRTVRTCLRRLREDDFPRFAQMNADPEVMRHFPRVWTLEESRTSFQRINAEFDEKGFGVYALEVNSTFAGVVGLSTVTFQSWFTPCVEMPWRLLPEHWGRGLATEAATAVASMAFRQLSLDAVFAFTVPANRRSVRVMEKVGMKQCQPPLFDHPGVDNPEFRQHVLYCAKRSWWELDEAEL
jgi:RimJ/RimL family protein N-acetyltransferase